MTEEEILGNGKVVETHTGEVTLYLKEHVLHAMKETYNTAIDDASKIIEDYFLDHPDMWQYGHLQIIEKKIQSLKK